MCLLHLDSFVVTRGAGEKVEYLIVAGGGGGGSNTVVAVVPVVYVGNQTWSRVSFTCCRIMNPGTYPVLAQLVGHLVVPASDGGEFFCIFGLTYHWWWWRWCKAPNGPTSGRPGGSGGGGT